MRLTFVLNLVVFKMNITLDHNHRNIPKQSPASTPPKTRDRQHRMASPELHKVTIDATGALVLKPEFALEDLSYKADTTIGGYVQKLPDHLPDHDPLDIYALQKITELREFTLSKMAAGRKQVEAGAKQAVAGGKKVVTGSKQAYNGIATPAKKQYKMIVSVPENFTAKLERENRAVKGELELARLRLAEARLQLRGAGVDALTHGVSTSSKLFKVRDRLAFLAFSTRSKDFN